jgi:hypothetical protein
MAHAKTVASLPLRRDLDAIVGFLFSGCDTAVLMSAAEAAAAADCTGKSGGEFTGITGGERES